MIAFLHVSDFSFWAWLAQIASGVAVYASRRAERTPVDDLTYRLRHPVRWTLEHPIKAVKRIGR